MANLSPAKSHGYYCKRDNQFHEYKNDMYTNEEAIPNLIHYVTRTGNRIDRAEELIGWGAACCCYLVTPDDCITFFLQIQNNARRDRNIKSKALHEILTFSDEEEKILLQNIDHLMEFGRKCSEIYYGEGFQCVFGIHYGIHCEDHNPESINKKRLHIHFVINAVNFITGNLFHTRISSKVFTMNQKTFFKIPYDTKEREQAMNKLLYGEYLNTTNPYAVDTNAVYFQNAYHLYPRSM